MLNRFLLRDGKQEMLDCRLEIDKLEQLDQQSLVSVRAASVYCIIVFLFALLAEHLRVRELGKSQYIHFCYNYY